MPGEKLGVSLNARDGLWPINGLRPSHTVRIRARVKPPAAFPLAGARRLSQQSAPEGIRTPNLLILWGQFWDPRVAAAAAECCTQEDLAMAAPTASTIAGRSQSTVLRTTSK